MTKTPEELAEEYATATEQEFSLEKEAGAYKGFLAGYQAAKDHYETKISELEIELENWKHTAIHGDEGL